MGDACEMSLPDMCAVQGAHMQGRAGAQKHRYGSEGPAHMVWSDRIAVQATLQERRLAYLPLTRLMMHARPTAPFVIRHAPYLLHEEASCRP